MPYLAAISASRAGLRAAMAAISTSERLLRFVRYMSSTQSLVPIMPSRIRLAMSLPGLWLGQFTYPNGKSNRRPSCRNTIHSHRSQRTAPTTVDAPQWTPEETWQHVRACRSGASGLDPHPEEVSGIAPANQRAGQRRPCRPIRFTGRSRSGRWFSSRIEDQAVISSATSARNRLSSAASSRDRPSRLHLVLDHPVPRMPSLIPRSAWRAVHADSRASRGVLFRERRRRRRSPLPPSHGPRRRLRRRLTELRPGHSDTDLDRHRVTQGGEDGPGVRRPRPGGARRVPAEPGLNTTQIQGKVRESGVGAQHGDVGKAATRLVDLGALRMEVGPRKAHNYFPTTTYPVLSRRVPRDSTSPIPTPYRGGRW